jgi:hypothetical protein
MTDKCYQCLHEARAHRVYITVGTLANVNDVMLVWNYENDTWNKWGVFWENHWPEGSSAGKAEYLLRFTQLGQEVKQFNADGPTVFFAGGTYYLHHFDPYQRDFYQPINWKIVTHPMGDSSSIKVSSGYKVEAKKTGNWNLVSLLLKDGESIEAALRRNASSYNYIIDATDAVEHNTNGTSYFTASTAGPVDLWYVPTMELLEDSRVITTATSASKIKFTTTFSASSTYIPTIGQVLVLPEDSTPLRTHAMNDTGFPLWDTATLDTAHTIPVEFGSVDFRTNCTGRKFRLLLTNTGVSEGSGDPMGITACKQQAGGGPGTFFTTSDPAHTFYFYGFQQPLVDRKSVV